MSVLATLIYISWDFYERDRKCALEQLIFEIKDRDTKRFKNSLLLVIMQSLKYPKYLLRSNN